MPALDRPVFESRTGEAPEEFLQKYAHFLERCRNDSRGFEVFEAFRYDDGVHPDTYVDHECTFSAHFLSKIKPGSILDIGSYRHFILGLLAHYHVTTVDVRNRRPATDHESVVTCDAKKLALPDEEFDAVLSLCAVEHFGLGRYGDEFDLDADRKGMEEMIRVLKPGGALIFTTTITRAKPQIAFNAHRIYDYAMIETFCRGLRLEGEMFYITRKRSFGAFEEVTEKTGPWDVYCGCWVKP